MIRVEALPANTLRHAAYVGVDRRLSGLLGHRTDRAGAIDPDKGWDNDVEGAVGEAVAASALGVYWAGAVGEFHAVPDLPTQGWDVRTVAPGRRLIIRPGDPDDRYTILVAGRVPGPWDVLGYVLNRDAKQDRFLFAPNDRDPAWFLDVDHIRAINPRPVR